MSDIPFTTYKPQSDDSSMLASQRQAAAAAAIARTIEAKTSSVGDHASGPANAPLVITYPAAGAGVANVISGLSWSADVAADIVIQIEDGSGNIIFRTRTEWRGSLSFQSPKKGTPNTALIVTQTAVNGPAESTLELNVLNHWTE